MINILHQLVGQSVRKVVPLHDYLQIYFDQGGILNIYNRYQIFVRCEGDVLSFVEKKATDIMEEPKAITFTFGADHSIRVFLLDADYRGPEAMEFIEKDGSRSIWS